MVDFFFNNTNPNSKEKKRKIFADLKIGKDNNGEYLKQVHSSPVIFLDFKSMTPNSYELFVTHFEAYIGDLFRVYNEDHNFLDDLKKRGTQLEILKFERLINGKDSDGKPVSEIDLTSSLRFLARLMQKKFDQPVIFLIDEVDYPIISMISNHYGTLFSSDKNTKESIIKQITDISKLISRLLSPICKEAPLTGEKELIRFTLMTGISNMLATNPLLNNVKVYSIADSKLSNYYGINEEEIEYLIQHLFIKIDAKQKQQLMNKIQLWYNGYENRIGNKIYNVWSVLKYIERILEENDIDLEPQKEWTSTGYDILEWIKPLFDDEKQLNSELMNCLVGLSRNKIISLKVLSQNIKPTILDFDISNFEDIIPYLLLSHGYLTYSGNNYRVPNKEILSELATKVIPMYCSKNMKKDYKTCDKTLPSLLNRNLNKDEDFKQILEEYILSVVLYPPKNESYFEMLIGGMIEYHAIMDIQNALYFALPQKTVSDGGMIDAIYSPNVTKITEDNNSVIIHEYKFEDKTNDENIKRGSLGGFWQIFCKKYISDPLSKILNSSAEDNPILFIKIRVILFHYIDQGRWGMNFSSFQYNIEESKKINYFFNQVDKSYLTDLCDKSEAKVSEFRNDFLKFYKMETLIKLIDWVKSTTEIIPIFKVQTTKASDGQQSQPKNAKKPVQIPANKIFSPDVGFKVQDKTINMKTSENKRSEIPEKKEDTDENLDSQIKKLKTNEEEGDKGN